jgi:hypothetical protein
MSAVAAVKPWLTPFGQHFGGIVIVVDDQRMTIYIPIRRAL